MAGGIVNSGSQTEEKRTFARLGFIRNSPEMAAILNKFVGETQQVGREADGSRRAAAPSDFIMGKLSAAISQNVTDAHSVFQVLPDMELARQILVSSILSPKDLVTTEVNYSVPDCPLSNELAAPMLDVVREHFEKRYKIKQLLPTILSDALFMTGSYPIAVLPENVIDESINSPTRVSMEAISLELDSDHRPRELGLLGSPVKAGDGSGTSAFSLENYAEVKVNAVNGPRELSNSVGGEGADFFKCISVTDNFNVLKMPMLHEKLIEDRIQDVLTLRRVGMEAHRDKYQDQSLNRELETSLYRPRRYAYTPLLTVKTQDQIARGTIGHPLVMKLASEAVIPVHVPSNPEEHIGYFVLVDETGNPINSARRSDYYNQMQSNYTMQQQNLSTQLLSSARAGQYGLSYDKIQEMDEAIRVYTTIVENDLLTRLRNGVYGKSVEISRPSEVYRIMFARALSKMHTQVLYIPAALMTYFAFDYDEHGIGRSLIEDSKILASIRSVLLFSNTMASIKNSIGRVGVKIGLDPADPNPTETVEQMLHQYAQNRQASYPLGVNNPRDIVSYLQNAGVDVAVTGHPAYPETTFDVESKQNNYTKPDTELEESMKKRHIMSMGLAPETVDLSMGADFATSVVTSNLLLAKRVLMFQGQFCEKLSDFVRKYTLNSGKLMDELREIVNTNIDKLDENTKRYGVDRIIRDFVSYIETALPAPDSVTLENQMKAFETYKGALQTAIDAYISTDFMEGTTLGELGGSVEVTRKALEAYFLRVWLAENNVLPELAAIVMVDEDGNPGLDLLEENEAHIEGLARSLEKFMTFIKENRAKRDKRVTAQDEKLGTTEPAEIGEVSSGGEDTPMDFGGGGDLGNDDFNLDEPAATDATPPEDGNGTQQTEEVVEEESSSSKTTTDEEAPPADEEEEPKPNE